ncbi:hypothetical protein [Clostridium felsineum]|uniref:hypothetical protein n=1 Tax=Clostridium felsineum TaxID=36839 RepID=UPI00098CDE66|nr:hypothetical protein [Clostridium felsineum]URZ17749.1 hypothetical protein CLFE_038040 [Clostridium felsineum DSM 794]
MRNKIFRKLVEIYDAGSLATGTLVSISIISYIVAKRTARDAKIWVCGVITLAMILGLIVQIMRKDREARRIKTYLFGTLIGIFVTSISYLMNKYYNNIVIVGYLVELFLCALAIVIIICTIIVLRNKNNRFKKGQKIFFVVFSIYCIVILIVVMILFKSKG